MEYRKTGSWKKFTVTACLLLTLVIAGCGPAKKSMTIEEACETQVAKDFENGLNTNPNVKITLSPKGEDTLVIEVQVKSAKKAEMNMAFFQTQMSDVAEKYQDAGVSLAEYFNDEFGTPIKTVSILFTDGSGERLYSIASAINV